MSGTRPVVAVVGGGIAGLAAAWDVACGGRADVIVLEASDRLGGKIRSADLGGRRIDVGPDSFVTRRPEALDLCREMGLQAELVEPDTSAAYVWSRGKLRRLPAGLALGVPTRLGPLALSGVLSTRGLGRAAVDLCALPLAGRRSAVPPELPDASIGELVRRRLGRQVVDRLADPLIGGIHAGQVQHMSAAAVFPGLLEAARQPGSLMRALRRHTAPSGSPGEPPLSVFASLHGGLGRLVERLGSALGEAGADIRCTFAVHALGPGERWTLSGPQGRQVEADGVVLAVPAPAATALLAPVGPRLAELVGAVRYAGVVLVTMRVSSTDLAALPPGSGFLVPRTSGHMVTACTWMSSKWPELARSGEVVVRVSLGHAGDQRPLTMDDDDLVRRACDELAPAMGWLRPPIDATVARFPDGFPQYAVGHPAAVAAMERAAAGVGGLALAGAYLQGVGIPACIASGRRAARAVSSRLEEAAWR